MREDQMGSNWSKVREKHPSIPNIFRQGDLEHEECVGSLEWWLAVIIVMWKEAKEYFRRFMWQFSSSSDNLDWADSISWEKLKVDRRKSENQKGNKRRKKKPNQNKTHHPCKTPSWARPVERKAKAFFIFQRALILILTRRCTAMQNSS